MLATSDELAAVSSRSLANADSGLFGIPSSSSGFPGVVSGLGDLPQQSHRSRFMPESLVSVDPINSSPAQLSHQRPEWLDLQPSSHRWLPRENSSTILNTDQLEGRTGVWTVGASGQVSVDYLIDGGSFQGELAVFSLQGMENLQPGSPAFTQEAARRALSQSVLEA